jgi:oligosaccharide reducing-end xylanase
VARWTKVCLFWLALMILPQASCRADAIVQPTRTLEGIFVPANTPQLTASPLPAQTSVPRVGAFTSGVYRNLFKEMLGKGDAEIKTKLDAAWQQLFYGNNDTERVYYPVGDDMGYIEDIGNNDVRTEGMSYGMMIAVQLDKKSEFDRLWKWTKKYMYQTEVPYKGYFAWHCKTNGTVLDANPASDGEEYFVMALLFAANRWSNDNYRAEAQAILDTMLHKNEENIGLATNMFDAKTKQIVFVPTIGRNSSFTDPSYHLPAFYELWARWAKHDNQFWAEAANESRAFFKRAANLQTGLMPDYAEFSGAPHGTDEHKDFRFDAFRAASNVAVDYAWFTADPWQVEESNRLLEFFYSQGIDQYVNQYSLDGKPLSSDRSPGLAAMNAVAVLAATTDKAPRFVTALWDAPIPMEYWRYYDGMLYLLGLLHASGNFRIYAPS